MYICIYIYTLFIYIYITYNCTNNLIVPFRKIYTYYTIYTLYPSLWTCDAFMARSLGTEALLAGSAPRQPDLQFLPRLSAGSAQSLEIQNDTFHGAQNRAARTVHGVFLRSFLAVNISDVIFWVNVTFWNPIPMDSFSKSDRTKFEPGGGPASAAWSSIVLWYFSTDFSTNQANEGYVYVHHRRLDSYSRGSALIIIPIALSPLWRGTLYTSHHFLKLHSEVATTYGTQMVALARPSFQWGPETRIKATKWGTLRDQIIWPTDFLYINLYTCIYLSYAFITQINIYIWLCIWRFAKMSAPGFGDKS